jgi:hypothetical protein
MRSPLVGATIVALGLALGPVSLSAQELKITCGGDLAADCSHAVGLADSVQKVRMTVKVTQSNGTTVVPGAIVRLSATSGVLEPDSIVTDANGEARAVWVRGKGADQVAVGVSARLGDKGNGTTFVRLFLTSGTDPKQIAMREEQGFQQSWFEKSQLPREVRVELLDSAFRSIDEKTCNANRVLFKGRGATQSVSPDTANAWFDSEEKRCFADTFWAFGEGIGERRLDVTVVGGKGYKGVNELEAAAWARAMPKFITGFAAGRTKDDFVILGAKTDSVFHVERPGTGGATLTYDSTKSVPGGPKPAESEQVFSAVAAVSIPIPIAKWKHWDGLSFTAGVDLAHPTQRQFYGLSAARFLLGRYVPVIEVLPIDLHVLRFYAQETYVTNPTCTPGTCNTDKRVRFQSWALMLSADASGLVADLVAKLVK